MYLEGRKKMMFTLLEKMKSPVILNNFFLFLIKISAIKILQSCASVCGVITKCCMTILRRQDHFQLELEIGTLDCPGVYIYIFF